MQGWPLGLADEKIVFLFPVFVQRRSASASIRVHYVIQITAGPTQKLIS
jgi:hypothetical protein